MCLMIAVSSNLTATYNDKGFHLIALRLDQNRKVFGLFFVLLKGQ
jgi:hypothetical protein